MKTADKTGSSVNFHYLLTFLVSFAENDVPLYKQLLLIRTLFKKSQGDLAREMGCNQSVLSTVESGNRDLSLKHLEAYCEKFDVQVVLVPKTMVPFLSSLLRSFYTHELKKNDTKSDPRKGH